MPDPSPDHPTPEIPAPAAGEPPALPPPPPVSLMITRRQRGALRALGLAEDEIRALTPAEAHAMLGL